MVEPDGNRPQETFVMLTQATTQVIGTIRWPSGANAGEIAGLVLNRPHPGGGYYVLTLGESIAWARRRLLWTRAPNSSMIAFVEPIDANNDNYYDGVRTEPDGTKANNLLSLPVYRCTETAPGEYRTV